MYYLCKGFIFRALIKAEWLRSSGGWVGLSVGRLVGFPFKVIDRLSAESTEAAQDLILMRAHTNREARCALSSLPRDAHFLPINQQKLFGPFHYVRAALFFSK